MHIRSTGGPMGKYKVVKIPEDLCKNVDAMIGIFGFKSRAEIVKAAIRDLLNKYGAVGLERKS